MNIEHNKPVIGVGIMVLDASGRILLGERIKSDEMPSWCFPGGKIDPHESFEQSATREIFEETGLLVCVSQLRPFTLMVNTNLVQSNSTVGLVYLLKDENQKKQVKVTEPEIFSQWSWFLPSQLPDNLFPATEAMIRIWQRLQPPEGWVSYAVQPSSLDLN